MITPKGIYILTCLKSAVVKATPRKKIKKVKEYLDTFNSAENLSKCLLLDFYIAHCMTSTMPIKLLVFDTGETLIGRQVAIDLAVQYGFIQDDYISIDIAKLINKISEETNTAIIYVSHRKEAHINPNYVYELVPYKTGSTGKIIKDN